MFDVMQVKEKFFFGKGYDNVIFINVLYYYMYQIFGRVGRLQFDKSGEGIIIIFYDKLVYYFWLLMSQFFIESQVLGINLKNFGLLF